MVIEIFTAAIAGPTVLSFGLHVSLADVAEEFHGFTIVLPILAEVLVF